MTGLLLTGLLLTQTPAAAPPPAEPAAAGTPRTPQLSELHQAQVEAHLAKLRALQLEVQLQQMALQEQRAKLEAAITASHPGWRMEWDRATLVPITAEPTETKDPPR